MSSKLLQQCSSLSNGIYLCKWRRGSESNSLSSTSIAEKIWWWTFLLIFIFATTWLFCWSVFSNDYDDFNTFIYEATDIWFGWGVLILSVFVVILFYLLLLLLSGVILIGSDKSRRLHLCHKIFISVILVLCITSYVLVSMLWNEEFYSAVIALIMMGQWFHICLLFIYTLSSWLFFYQIMQIPNRTVWIFAVFGVVSVFLLICFIPLFLHSPCVRDGVYEIKKPRIIAHRLGTTRYAPENTILSYQEALKMCGDFDVETDVSISYDGVPFLFHDTDNMKRTSNVEQVFPDLADQVPELFTWDQLQQLDVGSWFLEQNPYRNVHTMSSEYKAKIQQQKVPSLHGIAKLLAENDHHNQSIIFDLYTPRGNHPFRHNFSEIVLQLLLDAGLPEHQILWLPNNDRSKIKLMAPDIRMVSASTSISYLEYVNISIANVGYYDTTLESVYNFIDNNISVIQYRIETPWLFSYAWCQGTSFVTSNSCELLGRISQPIWMLTSGGYVALWVCVDILFLCILITIFFVQYYRSNCTFLPIFQERLCSVVQEIQHFDNPCLELSES